MNELEFKKYKTVSAGIMLYRYHSGGIEVLLGNPGVPYWINRHGEGCWEIPKGKVEDNEDIYEAAIREFEEETNITVPTDVDHIYLGTSLQKRKEKLVHAWAVSTDIPDSEINFESNTCTIEWPKGSGQKIEINELRIVEFFPIEEAKKMVMEYQIIFLERLEEYLEVNDI